MQSRNEQTSEASMTDADVHPVVRVIQRRLDARSQATVHRHRRIGVAAVLALCLSTLFGVVQSVLPTPALASSTNTLSTANFSVRSAADGSAILHFTYIINLDNTGATEQRSPLDGCSPATAGYPDTCAWTSMGVASSSPVVTQGTEADFASPGFDLADGRYLISVLSDDYSEGGLHYKIDGAHFTMPLDSTESVAVLMQPTPLPDTTIQAAVFEDISPVNGAPDLPAEHGLAGLTGVVRDSLGEVTTDVYGDPLCGTGVCLSYCYVVANGEDWGVVEPDAQGRCPSDAPTGSVMWALGNHLAAPTGTPNFSAALPDGAVIEGKIKIPNLGTNRFTLTVTPPDGSHLVQTTTLEGNHDWDSWVMEGATGLDTEFVVGGEPFPAIIFGFVDPSTPALSGTGSITGVVASAKAYVPANGGTTGEPGMTGSKIDKPIDKPWIALSDLTNGDSAVWIGQGDANGSFTIPNVPAGDYTITWWDEPQDYILAIQNVTVAGGEHVDLGVMSLLGWWTQYSGYVFNDLNRNGKMDWTDTNHNGCPDDGEGELGVPNYTLTMRRRDNTLMDRGTTVVGTDACGYYYMESAYPISQWLVMEAYNDLYFTTGVTYQADNQPSPTTVLGAGVDVSVLPIIGLSGTLDWGVHSYDPKGVTNGVDPQNGGIVGTVSYDTTRNELDPRYAAVEDWQPGVSGLTVELSQPVECLDPNTGDPQLPCDPDETYRLNSDGSYMSGPLLNTYVTETWSQPGADGNANGDGDCVPRDVDGNELTYPNGQGITASPTDCLEAPLMGIQFQKGFSAVDGNYGFGDGCFGGTLDATDPADPICMANEVQTLTLTAGVEGDSFKISFNGHESTVGVTIPAGDAAAVTAADVQASIDSISDFATDQPVVAGPDGGPFTITFSGALAGIDHGPLSVTNATGAAAATVAETAVGGPGSFESLAGASDYLVHVVVPTDAIHGRPLYHFTREEDINIGNGDEFVPQVPPPACVGALHTVDVAGEGTDGYPAVLNTDGSEMVPASVPTVNPTFLDLTPPGSPYEGQATPLCDTKLVPLNNGRSIVPTFNVFTDVPVPGRFWGLIVDDLNFSTDPQQMSYGEKAGVPFAPIGIYDYTNRLVYTAESDYSGLFDVLMPSTNRISCPTPSGVCGNVYRFVGNDPGTPGNLNDNYHPDYRTIAAEFEAIPGVLIPADLAPTQVGVSVQLPGAQAVRVQCPEPSTKPQLFAVSQPYVNGAGSFTIDGQGFGAAQGTGKVTLDGTAIGITSWNDQTIVAAVPSTIPPGPHQLLVTSANGQTTVNGLTFHVMDQPTLAAFTGGPIDDTFNTNNSGTQQFSNNWALNGSGLSRVNGTGTSNDYVQARTGSTFASARYSSSYGANQEAFFTLRRIAPTAPATQGLMLKWSNTSGNSSDPTTSSAQWIRVVVDNTGGTVTVSHKVGAGSTVVDGTIAAAFVNGNQLGARALADGTVIVYRNGVAVGSVSTTTGAWTGRTGMIFSNTGSTSASEAQIDDFGGGNIVSTPALYNPNLYEVGPGRSYSTIQSAVDAANASTGNDLIVVYPNTATTRLNPRGAYYENLILSSPVKLQGVGPGGIRDTGSNRTVPGSIIDGSAFAGDSATFDGWYATLGNLPVIDADTGAQWDGNQTVFDGAVISIFATQSGERAFGTSYKAAIDGFDLRGGDQQGFPGNINSVGGGATGQPAGLITQGGAVFANAYARNLQITNNVVQNNGGAYGTIRIGTADLPAPDTNQHNENVRIANNRIIANAGTNLAGGIGLFGGSDNYVVTNNDICGNFSAEYGGGITAYGFSPNGLIQNNRIWFNRSYDEGGGIMIGGALPSDPANASPGTGSVTIRGNVIQSNVSNDDGGGLRFLMAGTQTMYVYNNMIVNNVSTHEGGGVALNDTTNVRFYNNTVMKNLTTATAVTSNGSPAPAGLSTSRNSVQLGGGFSNPLLFNNIFWDNRAGTRNVASVTGLTAADKDVWDLGSIDGAGPLTPTNSVISQLSTVARNYTDSANVHTDPNVVAGYDSVVTFNGWRTNPNFIGAILVSADLPPELLGDYHVQTGSSAIGLGAPSKSGVNAPAFDIDGDARPSSPGFEAGADEIVGAVTPPPTVFPTNATPLDTFSSGPLSTNWIAPSGYTLSNDFGGTMSGASITTTTPARWRTGFGRNQEAYFTLTDKSNTATEHDVILKWATNSMIKVAFTGSAVEVRTLDGANGWVTHGTLPTPSLASGFRLGAQAFADGRVDVYQGTTLVGSVNVRTAGAPWPAALSAAGGQIGVGFVGTKANSNGDAHIDDFGGGTLP